jgi:hypothetical protein
MNFFTKSRVPVPNVYSDDLRYRFAVNILLRGLFADVRRDFDSFVTIKEISSNYTITENDKIAFFLVTTGSSTITLTLPALVDSYERTLYVAKVDSGSGSYVVSRAGSDTINGGTSVTGESQYSCHRITGGPDEWLSFSIGIHAIDSPTEHSSDIAQNHLLKADANGLPSQAKSTEIGDILTTVAEVRIGGQYEYLKRESF